MQAEGIVFHVGSRSDQSLWAQAPAKWIQGLKFILCENDIITFFFFLNSRTNLFLNETRRIFLLIKGISLSNLGQFYLHFFD